MWCGKLCCRFSCSVNSSAVWLWQMAHRRALMMLVLHMCVCVAYVEMPKQSIFRSNTRRRWGMHTTYTYNTAHTHARLAHTHTTTGCIYAWSWRRSVFFVFSTSHHWQQLNEFGKFDEHTNMSYVSVWCMLGAYDVSVCVCGACQNTFAEHAHIATVRLWSPSHSGNEFYIPHLVSCQNFQIVEVPTIFFGLTVRITHAFRIKSSQYIASQLPSTASTTTTTTINRNTLSRNININKKQKKCQPNKFNIPKNISTNTTSTGESHSQSQ